MSFKTPATHLKLKFLKVVMIRFFVLSKFIFKNNYLDTLNRSITDKRTIING